MKRQLSIASRLPIGQAREQHRESVAKERACQETADELKAALAEARAALVLAAAERRRAEDDLEAAEAVAEGDDDAKNPTGTHSPIIGGRA